MGVFAALILALISVAVLANSVLLGILSAVVLGVILREFLPEDRVQSKARALATGEAGDQWRQGLNAFGRRLARWMPW